MVISNDKPICILSGVDVSLYIPKPLGDRPCANATLIAINGLYVARCASISKTYYGEQDQDLVLNLHICPPFELCGHSESIEGREPDYVFSGINVAVYAESMEG